MAGGTGSRLWPLSREAYPKQFLSLTENNNSMLQETLLRLDGINTTSPIVICNQRHRFLVAEQLRLIGQLDKNIILEPVGRNTAPAIALAAFNALLSGDDSLMLVLAADHVINDKDSFHSAIEKALPHANSGNLVTFGIVPTGPETGYGYIKRGSEISNNFGNSDCYTVGGFVEKPNLSTAIQYIESKDYYWNSGMFLFKPSVYLEELKKFRPDIYECCEKSMAQPALDANQDFVRVDENEFTNCPDESVDYAVMEKTDKAVVVPLDAGWSDVGSWSALWDINNKDENNNVKSGDVFTHNSNNCYIKSDDKFISVIGASNLVVVSTHDALLVIDKSQVQDVKKTVDFLKSQKRQEHIEHIKSYTPWGSREKIVEEQRYVINRLTINPNGKFSLQMHHHRVEHWVVLSGTAKVTIEDREFLLTENQSTFIPIGKFHMLENPGKIQLEILEIQSGEYLSSDDITRLKEFYNI